MSFFRPSFLHRVARGLEHSRNHHDAHTLARCGIPTQSLSHLMDEVLNLHNTPSIFSVSIPSHSYSSTPQSQRQQQQEQQHEQTQEVARTNSNEIATHPRDGRLRHRRGHRGGSHDLFSFFFDEPLFPSIFKGRPSAWQLMEQTAPTINVNIYSSSTAYTVHAEVPGVKKEDIKISVEDGQLVIETEKRAERRSPSTPSNPKTESKDTSSGATTENAQNKSEPEEEVPTELYVESSYGHAERRVTLPEDASLDGDWKANYDHGIIKIVIPRVQQQNKRRVVNLE